jgi:hypothetical protein
MTSPAVLLRPVIRQAMQEAPKMPFTAASLHRQLAPHYPAIGEDDVVAALLWNQSKGYVDFEHNAELEVDVYRITKRGLQTK